MKAHLQRKHYVGCAKFLLFSGIALLPTEVLASDSAILQLPVRLETIDGFVDTGDALGHSGPCMEDVDGDGMRDLIVGDFSGQFRSYRNIGSDAAPRYAKHTYLKAGGTVAKVPIY